MSRDSKREVLGITSISHKFQITVPKAVREKQKIKAGDRIMFVEESSRIYITKSTEV